jgi:hypothetical protein
MSNPLRPQRVLRTFNPRLTMAKLLHTKRASRRFSNVVRTWLALRRQRRRRNAGSGTPAAPVITGASLTESEGVPLYWFDVLVEFTFDQGRLLDGTIEVWWARESQGWAWTSLGSTAITNRVYRHIRAFSDFEGDDAVHYKMRYRSDGGVVGPFSAEYEFGFAAP